MRNFLTRNPIYLALGSTALGAVANDYYRRKYPSVSHVSQGITTLSAKNLDSIILAHQEAKLSKDIRHSLAVSMLPEVNMLDQFVESQGSDAQHGLSPLGFFASAFSRANSGAVNVLMYLDPIDGLQFFMVNGRQPNSLVSPQGYTNHGLGNRQYFSKRSDMDAREEERLKGDLESYKNTPPGPHFFPQGAPYSTDENHACTAIREAEEETGQNLRPENIVGMFQIGNKQIRAKTGGNFFVDFYLTVLKTIKKDAAPKDGSEIKTVYRINCAELHIDYSTKSGFIFRDGQKFEIAHEQLMILLHAFKAYQLKFPHVKMGLNVDEILKRLDKLSNPSWVFFDSAFPRVNPASDLGSPAASPRR